jgi:catechol 2,3-dioxygenase-like lactoylglutathione lyase family enzyme
MAPAVTVTGLDHIVLATPDIERSLRWYTEVLGLPGERVDEWRAGDVFFPSVRLDATTLIDIFPGAAVPSGAPRNLVHFCVVIEPADLDELAASGRFDVASGPDDGLYGAQGFARSLYVYDPDGNTVELRSY